MGDLSENDGSFRFNMNNQEYKIVHNQVELVYQLVKNGKARHVSIAITEDGVVKVCMPRLLPEVFAHKFVREKIAWINRKINEIKTQKKIELPAMSRPEYHKYRLQAYELVLGKIEKFNQYYNLEYGRICIKDQKTRWGSCSSNRNLNFNFKMLLLPDHLVEYIVVHEMCHLIEMNHSIHFWNQVARTVPGHKGLRSELKKIKIV
ncbi:MAG: DUF45 domain-containing protein [Candidatus Falkowbacteria bacterium]|nr:DUF45 domain-containing protein [Candidatus Falkowbacteria bacterium]